MTNKLFEQILDDHKELSSLPQTLSEVLRITRDENSSARQLSDTLLRDPALTAKVLRAANSPFYGAGREITTVSQAVVTLGMRVVQALALSTSIYDITSSIGGSIDRQRFWRHSLECALAARQIAKKTGHAGPEEAFICGLLHDVGLLVLESSFPDKYARIWPTVEAGERLHEVEEEIWGTNHARVGQFLFEQWQFPSLLSDAVGFHHQEFVKDMIDPEFRLAQVVSLANHISQFPIVRAKPERHSDARQMEIILANLGLSRPDLAELQKQLMAMMLDESSFLEIDIGSPQELLIEANRMLYDHYLTVERLLEENRRANEQIAKAKMKQAALESLKTITATFNHYLNNAAGTILGRAQLIEVGVERGEIKDPKGDVKSAMGVIINGVTTIRSVLEELGNLTNFETTVYHDDTYILDIEDRIKREFSELDSKAAVS